MPALFCYCALGVILWVTRGMFNPLAVAGLCIGIGYFLTYPFKAVSDQQFSTGLKVVIALFFGLLAAQPNLIYVPGEELPIRAYLAIRVSIIFAAIVFFAWIIFQRERRPLIPLLVTSIGALLFAYLLVLQASPNPFIDVFVIDSLAVDHLLAGINPYVNNYPDIYQGAYGYAPSFTYWPAYLLTSVFGRLAGDVRLTNLAALIICGWGIYFLSRRNGGSRSEAYLLGLALAAFPVGLFILEQAWVDPILCACAVLLAVAMQEKRWMLAAIIAGATVATKQYGMLITFPALVYLLRIRGWKEGFILACIAGVVSLLFLVPFLIWDAATFYKATVSILIEIPNRPDSLSLPALLHFFTKAWPPGILLLLIYICLLLGGGAYLLVVKEPQIIHWAFAVTFVHAGIFLAGKQAFCNYYYLLAILILLMLSLRRQWSRE